MNRDDIIDVLTAVSAGTGREIGEVDVQLWQSVIGAIPKDFALSAVFAHFRDRPGVWLEPGHIFERWRDYRRDQAERESDEERNSREDDRDRRLGLARAIEAAGIGDIPPRPSQRRDGKPNPLSIRCPWCHAGEFRPCKTPNTDVTLRNPHPSRIEAVSK
jgi:hypothetical protein